MFDKEFVKCALIKRTIHALRLTQLYTRDIYCFTTAGYYFLTQWDHHQANIDQKT
jgi:hypothetical protein